LTYRQSARLLHRLVAGMGELMELLDLDEMEVDDVFEQMLSYDKLLASTEALSDHSSVLASFVPRRTVDADTMRLKCGRQGVKA